MISSIDWLGGNLTAVIHLSYQSTVHRDPPINRSATLLRADVNKLLHTPDGRASTVATVVAIICMKSIYLYPTSALGAGIKLKLFVWVLKIKDANCAYSWYNKNVYLCPNAC